MQHLSKKSQATEFIFIPLQPVFVAAVRLRQVENHRNICLSLACWFPPKPHRFEMSAAPIKTCVFVFLLACYDVRRVSALYVHLSCQQTATFVKNTKLCKVNNHQERHARHLCCVLRIATISVSICVCFCVSLGLRGAFPCQNVLPPMSAWRLK